MVYDFFDDGRQTTDDSSAEHSAVLYSGKGYNIRASKGLFSFPKTELKIKEQYIK
jgi:hypothetical protein